MLCPSLASSRASSSWASSTNRQVKAVHPSTLDPSRCFKVRFNRNNLACRSAGDDGGFLDLTKLVTSAGNSNKTAFDGLASSIGKDIYVDIGGWHLYLRDLSATPSAKMSQALAVKLGPQASDRIKEADVEAVLKQVPVKLGGGKTQVSLLEVMPSGSVRDLTRILEDYARDKR